MALTYGFYNAELVDGVYDRTYDAEDFGKMFEGIITDGIFPTYGKNFKVSKYEELKVRVGTGKAWFNGTWTILDKDFAVSVASDSPLTAIVLEINKKTRKNSLRSLPFGNKVTLVNDSEQGIYQYCLAYVRVANGAIADIESHIANGSENVTPWATSLFGGGSSGGSVSASTYTTGIKFIGSDKFELSFKDEKGLDYMNEFGLELDSKGRITKINNKTVGRSIVVSYG